MSVFKCKMCGGNIEFEQGASVGVCEFCGTKQTLPKTNDDVTANLFNRANNLRLKCEFDKAEQIYEKIVQQDDSEAEAHWGIVLCKYGIEYVEDPKTSKRIPTCHRTLFEAVTADPDYLAAIDYSDAVQQSIYEAEARTIDRIQKDILAIVKNEKPFDVFICYKETDENGKRTVDSTIANDIYYQLKQEGFKVFYAAITLEDKLGQEYEPYIFAALNSAKVMLAVGTKPEYFNAVWVKNEWSRYLKLMKSDRSKLLIPCYRDMDAYDLPEEFAHLQAQDMGKIGFINDVVRGIKKVTVKEPAPVKETVVVNAANADAAPLLKRAFIFLEDGNWQEADEYCEKVLDQDPECAEAYLGKLMAELQVTNRKKLADCAETFDDRDNYSKVLRFGDEALEKEMRGYITHINERNENTRLTGIYDFAQRAMRNAKYIIAAAEFKSIPGFKDADALAEQCLEKAEICRKDAVYASAKSKMTGEKVTSYEEAIKEFQTISGWKDADEQIYACQKKIEELKAKEEADRLEAERKAEELKAKEEADRMEAERKAEERRIAAEKAAKKRKKAFAIGTPIVAACIAFVIVLTTVIIPNSKYNAAIKLMDDEKYEEAITAFEALNGYKDSENQIESCYIGKYGEEKWNKIKNIKIGDTYTFGAYEQDNNTSNGKEAIEWTVLDKGGMSLLLISKQALDCQQYNTEGVDITWENCSLRKWMNGTFLNNAFSTEEQAQIQNTTVSADKNPEYNTNPGNATTDKVFLLSIAEAEKYFTTDESRKCAPTAYAKAQGAYTSDSNTTAISDDHIIAISDDYITASSDSYITASGEATCCWLLRSPGVVQFCAACVSFDGSVGYYGSEVNYDCDGVRPALWINIGE